METKTFNQIKKLSHCRLKKVFINNELVVEGRILNQNIVLNDFFVKKYASTLLDYEKIGKRFTEEENNLKKNKCIFYYFDSSQTKWFYRNKNLLKNIKLIQYFGISKNLLIEIKLDKLNKKTKEYNLMTIHNQDEYVSGYESDSEYESDSSDDESIEEEIDIEEEKIYKLNDLTEESSSDIDSDYEPIINNPFFKKDCSDIKDCGDCEECKPIMNNPFWKNGKPIEILKATLIRKIQSAIEVIESSSDELLETEVIESSNYEFSSDEFSSDESSDDDENLPFFIKKDLDNEFEIKKQSRFLLPLLSVGTILITSVSAIAFVL